MLRFICLISCFVLFSCHYNQKNPINEEEEQCFFAPPDASLDSIRQSLKAKENYLEDYFSSLNRSGVFNGNILVAENGQIIYSGSFGYADRKTKEPLNLNTRFQLASITKVFTAIATLQLYEKGLLGLDDDVRKFIPEFPYEGVKIRHLLSHRSGIPRHDAFSRKQWPWEQAMSNDDMLRLFVRYKPNRYFKPGKRHDYSNAGFAFLALVIQRVSKMSYKEYIEQHIFKPCSMTESFVLDIFHLPLPDSIAYGHMNTYRYALQPEQDHLNGVVGDKGVYSTVIDMFKFDQHLYSNTLLKPETLELAFEKTIRSRYSKYEDYGFGHRLKDYRQSGDFIPYHSGWWRGFKTLFIRDIYTHKTIVIMSNREISPQSGLIWNMLNL